MSTENIVSYLFPKVRQRLLSILMLHPKKEFYLRELIRMSRTGAGAVQRELASLEKGGVVLKRTEGNRVYYKANVDSPIYGELKSIIIKTAGLADVIRSALKPLSREIDVAFIYGSFARGDEKPASDIDLMVIGDVGFEKVVSATASLQNRIGREIMPTVYKSAEFARKLRDGQHFCSSVLNGEKIFVIGDRNELERLVQSRVAD